ncbi:MAG: DUF1376 domain-containing protein [Janthinobacterium lividum]
MNFYKRHIGDYIKDAGHLSLLEHGVYCRLLDVYYTRETGIPEDKAARLVGARSKDELAALGTVLEEFFTLTAGVWRQHRCEEEIASMQKPEPEEGEEPKESRESRQQRYRARRAAIFETLHVHGVTMDWNTKMDDLQDALLRVTTLQKPSPPVTAPVTPVTRNEASHKRNVTATISQTPDSINQTTNPGEQAAAVVLATTPTAAPDGTRIGELCQALRGIGISAAPGQFLKTGWDAVLAGFDNEFIVATARAKRDSTPHQSITAAYLLPGLSDMLKPQARQHQPQGYESARDRSRRETFEGLTGSAQHDSRPDLKDIN